MKTRVYAGMALALALASGAAAQDFAFTVEAVNQGTTNAANHAPVGPSRSNPANALGAPNDLFFSLGMGGSMVLGFGGDFGTSVTVWETTTGNIANHPEQADIFVGYGASPGTAQFWFVDTVFNNADGIPLSLGAVNAVSGRTTYNFVRIVDTSNPAALPELADGFDVDSVAVVLVPAPGSAALLAAAGLVGLRRRRR
ncbi:MAG: PEP-CTERM sorting domain-containing protein [Phycisphaerales bacterium]